MPRPLAAMTNLLTKFHEDRKINVASIVLTRKNAPPTGGHVFQPTDIIFVLFQDIIGMNLLTKFHEDWKINVASRVITRFYYSHIRKNAPPLGSHVFQANVTIFALIQNIIETNFLTKFHEDWTINVASRVFTRKNAPTLGSHVFHANVTIFVLIQDIIQTNLLTKFHEDWTINVASRVKTAPPPGSHVFSPIWTILELVRDINETNVLTKFHDDCAKIVILNTAPPPGGHFHEDWASNVTSTVFTSMTQFHTQLRYQWDKYQAINVASRVFTRQNVYDDDGQKAITKAHHERAKKHGHQLLIGNKLVYRQTDQPTDIQHNNIPPLL
ncbi:hypothetical protein DPMN_035666 [Dreissena polymorpha]|uniref:Uncharacterized protein n=1 Tax=Dreissena polymorpha TaxID=45954 RepID=A0A9D4M7Z8_DREPO|nr:hypothetical protein DPMN_035666 [Dreissena polymorpha]